MNAAETEPQYVILCVDDHAPDLEAIARDVRSICGDAVRVETCADAEETFTLVRRLAGRQAAVPLVFADHALPGLSGTDLHIQALESLAELLINGAGGNHDGWLGTDDKGQV